MNLGKLAVSCRTAMSSSVVIETLPTLSDCIIPANQTSPAAWSQGEAAKNWRSPTFGKKTLAQLELLVLKHPNQWPVGGQPGKEFTQDPLGSLQELIDWAIGHRDNGLPLYTMMGGWRKMAEILADMKLMLKQYRFKEGTRREPSAGDT